MRKVSIMGERAWFVWALLWTVVVGLVSASAGQNADSSLLWGPYRPNLYFAMRPRVPDSFSFGLMWTTVEEDGTLNLKKLRHTCGQKDDMNGYGWTTYDPRTGGSQTIDDHGNHLKLVTDLWKREDGRWIVNIEGKLQDTQYTTRNVSLIWYIAAEQEPAPDSSTEGPSALLREASDGAIIFSLLEKQLGKSVLRFTRPTTRPKHEQPNPLVFRTSSPKGELWKAKETFVRLFSKPTARAEGITATSQTIPDDSSTTAQDMHFVQWFFSADFGIVESENVE